MGSLFSRSSRFRGTKSKRTKGKHKELEQIEESPAPDRYHTENYSNQYSSDRNSGKGHGDWDTRVDCQQMSNYNDSPDAPSNYTNSHPMLQNEIMNQSWPSHDVNDQYYPMNPLTMTSSNHPYDSNQHMHNQVVSSSMSQSQQIPFEERSSKKVQFAPFIQQELPAKLPLNSTQSWHEPSITTNDTSMLMSHQDSSLTRQPVHRSVAPTSNNSSSQGGPEKPIYVGIDHRATLAERGQRTTNKRQHVNADRNNIDVSNSNTNNHRARSHTHHQHKHQESNDASNSKGNPLPDRLSDLLQTRTPNTHRTLVTTSTSIMARPTYTTEQTTSNDNEVKQSKRRQVRQLEQHPQIELQSPVDNEMKTSKQRGNHSLPQKQPSHSATNRNSSPLRSDLIRRIESPQEITPIMRASVSAQSKHTQRQKQMTSMPPIATNSISATRARV